MANEIKAKQTGSVALFGDDLSKGFENMTQEDMALPFVRILGHSMVKKVSRLFLVTTKRIIRNGRIEGTDQVLQSQFIYRTAQ